MENANELLGLLHGAYGLGATISPLIATSMITKGDLSVRILETRYPLFSVAVIE